MCYTCYNLVTSLHKTGLGHFLCGAEIDAQCFDYKGGLKQTGSKFVMIIMIFMRRNVFVGKSSLNYFAQGVIQQLRGQNFAIFLPLPPPDRQFLYPENGRKTEIF